MPDIADLRDRVAKAFAKSDGTSIAEAVGMTIGRRPPARDIGHERGPVDRSDWRTLEVGTATVSEDGPLRLALSPGTTGAGYVNAEVLSCPAYPSRAARRTPSGAGAEFAVSLSATDWVGRDGSCGWGYGTGQFLAPLASYAFFTAIAGPPEANALPAGFYAFTLVPGRSPDVHRLDDALIGAERTYAVTLLGDRTVFAVDGATVHVSDAVPAHRVKTRVWVDNAGYVHRTVLGRRVGTRLRPMPVDDGAAVVVTSMSARAWTGGGGER